MQDKASPHFARDVCDWLNEHFGGRLMGHGSPTMPWPSRSPDLTPCDFFLGRFIKSKVYTTKPRDIPELKNRIRNAFGQVTDKMQQKALLEYRDRLEPIQKMKAVISSSITRDWLIGIS
uniref:Transposase n=1 Tax=Plectus sambesii TaxID=2011161 RepID=A0A914UIG9_9BILA